MTNNLATIFTLLVLGLTACFGYYQGFLTLATRRIAINSSRRLLGKGAIVVGLLYVVAAILVSCIIVLFYFSL